MDGEYYALSIFFVPFVQIASFFPVSIEEMSSD